MADEEINEQEEDTEQSVADALDDGKGGAGGMLSKILRILLPVGILVLAAGAGHFASGLGGDSGAAPAEAAAAEEPPSPDNENNEYTYYDLDPIIVNLNVPRLERYIRATLTLAIRNDDYRKASKVIEKRMPELKNSLILYLSDCSLDEVRGAKNLNRILREIQDLFNERLWPNQRPLIIKIDCRDWTIQ